MLKLLMYPAFFTLVIGVAFHVHASDFYGCALTETSQAEEAFLEDWSTSGERILRSPLDNAEVSYDRSNIQPNDLDDVWLIPFKVIFESERTPQKMFAMVACNGRVEYTVNNRD